MTVDLAPVTVGQSGATAGTAFSHDVIYGNVGGAGTITLANGGDWTALGYSVGGGIFIGSTTDPNANSATFDPNATNPYYTIASISADHTIITLAPGVTLNTSVTVNLSPVTITPGATGTITRTDGQNWAALGYTVGNGIFVGASADPNGNGTTFSNTAPNPYYTITAINGNVLTVTGKVLNGQGHTFTPESHKTVDAAPVAINLNSNASQIKFVLIGQSRDIAISATGTVDATAGGFIYLGSQDNVKLDKIVAGTSNAPADARIKTQGNVTDAATAGQINVQGSGIVIEAGQGFIGTSATPVLVNILGPLGSLSARALNDIYINAPLGNIPVDAIYSASGGVYMVAGGSITDFVTSDFAKIQANDIRLQADTIANPGTGIGTSGIGTSNDALHALHVDIVGGKLAAEANLGINIYQTDGSLNVLSVLSAHGDVALFAQANILNAGYLADPTNPFGVAQGPTTAVGPANVYGNNIVLGADAAQNSLGGIGSGAAANAFFIQSSYSAAGGTLTAAGNRNMFITQPTADILLASISDIGAVALITANLGSILNGNTTDAAIVVAGAAQLVANRSVGSSASTVGGTTGRIVGTMNNIEAAATTGDIWLWNIGPLTVGHVPGDTDPFALLAPHGQINILTSSPLEISADIIASGSITKQAGTAAAIDDNLTVDAGVTIQSVDSTIDLKAGNNVWLQSGATLRAVSGVTISSGIFDTGPIGTSVNATVNFSVNSAGQLTSMTLADTNAVWGNSFLPGDQILIGRGPTGVTTQDITRGDNYLTIASVVGGVITFVPQANSNTSQPFTAETNVNVTVTDTAAKPVNETVSFNQTGNVATMTLAALNTSWDPSLVVGEEIFIGGPTVNATQGDQYLQIASIVNGTVGAAGVITFARDNTVTTESAKTVTLTPALRDVRIDSGVIIDTTNVPEINSPANANPPNFVPSGAPADPTSTITINSANSVHIDATAVLKAAAAIDINAGYVPGIGFINANVTLDLFGSYIALAFNVQTGAGNDDIEFSPRALSTTTTINGGSGDDLIHVFGMPSTMTGVPTTPAGSQITATVSLDGQGGADEYLVDATADFELHHQHQ